MTVELVLGRGGKSTHILYLKSMDIYDTFARVFTQSTLVKCTEVKCEKDFFFLLQLMKQYSS